MKIIIILFSLLITPSLLQASWLNWLLNNNKLSSMNNNHQAQLAKDTKSDRLLLLPLTILEIIDTLIHENDFQKCVNEWKKKDFAIEKNYNEPYHERKKIKDLPYNKKLISDLQKSIIKTYGPSNLAYTCKAYYTRLKRESWQDHLPNNENFRAFWWQIPTDSLTELYEQHHGRNEGSFHHDPSLCLTTGYQDHQTILQLFSLINQLIKYQRPTDELKRHLKQAGHDIHTENPIIFSWVAHQLRKHNYQDPYNAEELYTSFISDNTVIDTQNLPAACPLTTLQQMFLKLLLPKTTIVVSLIDAQPPFSINDIPVTVDQPLINQSAEPSNKINFTQQIIHILLLLKNIIYYIRKLFLN